MWLAHAALITQPSLSQHTITGNTACHCNVRAHASVPTHATCRSAHIPILHPDTRYHTSSILHPQLAAWALHTLGPQELGERVDFKKKNSWDYFVSHSRLHPQRSRIVKKVDLGPTPSTGRVGARACAISVERQEAGYCLPRIWRDCVPQTGCAKLNVHSASSAHAYHGPLSFEPSSFLPLECSFPLSLPIEIFPFPQCLAQAPPPLKRPAGNDLPLISTP